MKVSFFPGCSLEGTAREYGESIQTVCSTLNVVLEELDDWTCCGASSAHCTSRYLATALPGRNLALAESVGSDLVTPCAACFSRLKTAVHELSGSDSVAREYALKRPVNVRHILEFLCSEEMVQGIEERIVKPLTGLKALSYYGCLLVRPPNITEEPHWEDPRSLDALLIHLGAECIYWSYKTECCGGSLLLTNVDISRRLIGRMLDMACETEAECIVTACPLCQVNLDTRQDEIGELNKKEYSIPVFYFSELMGLAFNEPDAGKWLRRHIVDPQPLLKAKGLL